MLYSLLHDCSFIDGPIPLFFTFFNAFDSNHFFLLFPKYCELLKDPVKPLRIMHHSLISTGNYSDIHCRRHSASPYITRFPETLPAFFLFFFFFFFFFFFIRILLSIPTTSSDEWWIVDSLPNVLKLTLRTNV